MEAEKRNWPKRCKHGLIVGECSLCLGVPRKENRVDPFAIHFANRPVFIRRLNKYPFNSPLDEEVVMESACSLL
jgi:hypothetical protein